MEKQKIAVILSGCGALDGSEIHEATLTLLALDRANLAYHCLAPNMPQTRVMNTLTQEISPTTTRYVLEESARIARGNIQDIGKANATEYAGVIVIGGYGAALNLCNYGKDKKNYSVQTDVSNFIRTMIATKKPAGFICIAPVLIPKLYPAGVTTTIGNDASVAAHLEQLGAIHVNCIASKCIVDDTHRVISTPAYMLAHSIKEVAQGIECLVSAMVDFLHVTGE